MAKNESEGVSRRDILGTGLTVATLAGTTGLVTGGTAVMIAQPDTAKADDDEDHHKKALIPPGKARRILRLLVRRTLGRIAHSRPALHARTHAHSRIQPLQCVRAGASRTRACRS